MNLNYRMILRIMGVLFLVMGGSMLLPFAISMYYGEYHIAQAFIEVALPSILTGILIIRLIIQRKKQMKLRDGIFIVSFSWFFCAVLGSMPFVLSGTIYHPIDAFFETCSGFSTTGFSIINDVEILPKGILFWRSFTHWLGGMGILVFAVALLPALGITGQTIASLEAPGPTLSKLTPKMSDTARRLYLLYMVFTIIETLLLMAGNMSFFDAICHSFSTLGTGGFSNYNNSIGHFNSPYIEGIITVFMFISAINFNLYFVLAIKGIKAMYKDEELRLFTICVATSTIVITVNLFLSGTFGLFNSFRYSAFQLVSLITTTGFSSNNFGLWPTFSMIILMSTFFIGGCSSSTAGGIKSIRVLVLLKMVKRSIALRLHPRAITSVKINGENLTSDTVSNIANFLFLYIALFMFGGFILSFDNFDLITCISVSASCLGNIGQAFGSVAGGASMNIFSYPSKLIMSFLMIAGRLEVFPLFMLLSKRFWVPYE